MTIKRITVLGAGSMGHGIAQITAMTGYEVNMRDIREDLLDQAVSRIKWSLGKFVQMGKISEKNAEKTIERIKPIVSLREAVESSDYVIEAIPEILRLKQQTFKEIDKYAPQSTILATNTSALPISELAEVTERPAKVIGMHFFNPAQLMRLIELVLGDETSKDSKTIRREGDKVGRNDPCPCGSGKKYKNLRKVTTFSRSTP